MNSNVIDIITYQIILANSLISSLTCQKKIHLFKWRYSIEVST